LYPPAVAGLAALIGSILANLLLVLGLCFVVGGIKHGYGFSTGN